MMGLRNLRNADRLRAATENQMVFVPPFAEAAPALIPVIEAPNEVRGGVPHVGTEPIGH